MIAIVSPAKTLDFETPYTLEPTLPRFQKEALQLIAVLKEKSEKDIESLMSISEKLATLNVERYHNFTKKKNPAHSKPAMLAFQGDVYQGLEADTFSDKEVAFAQDHFRILSGLYGILRPLDLIQPYRLEMGTHLKVGENKNLYEFWKDVVAKTLNKDLKNQGDKVLVNLASVEYFKSVDKDQLKGKIIDVDFKDFKSGQYKIISFYAKKARGLMARYIIKNQISKVEDLKGFDYEGYWYDEKESTDSLLAFKRD
ncbi:peroxide stress protein YaaA [Fulvivirga ligni]|uniref:peroxide stress protein YaaA n=1 Tax=Fulvivirga ligni TaxID=2904246 RepID=UPI001F16A34D|nr:peroxide stress protein YaaA [Fulvivirga ligni]UII19468.1 peroxide stress protein YaaA [Fulvivirga ligni]